MSRCPTKARSDRMRPTGLKRTNLIRRLVSTAVIVPLVVAAAWLGGSWFVALLSAVAAIGSYELANLMFKSGGRPVVPLSVIWSVGIVVSAHLHVSGHPFSVTILPTLAVGLILALSTFFNGRGVAYSSCDYLATVASALLSGGLLVFGVLMRALDNGDQWVITMLLVIAAADVGGYAVGIPFGRRKLLPSVSPGKSWEGAVGGLGAAMVVSVAATAGLGLPISIGSAIGLGSLLWAGALCGDLGVSGLKRLAHVKDSSSLIPGHGGVFDRLDSIVLNLVLCYYFIVLAVLGEF